MKFTIAIALLLISAPPAFAGGTAFYQPSKAAQSCAEGKKNAEAEKADLATAQAQLQKCQETAAKAKAACDKSYRGSKDCNDADAKAKAASDLWQRLQAQLQQRQQAHSQRLGERMQRVVAIARKARHLGALVAVDSILSDLAPDVDVTPEIVRRLDAGEGVSPDEKIAELQRQLAEANAKLAKATPPPAPSKDAPKK